MATMRVELVSPERAVWTGEASYVGARTVAGGIGILPGHESVLAALDAGVVVIRPPDGEDVVAAVSGGFLSVTGDAVSVLAEAAELAADIDAAEARRELDELGGADPDDPDAQQRLRMARARVRATGS